MPRRQKHNWDGLRRPSPVDSPEILVKSIQPGMVIGGCEIQSLIAKGGMGAVYLGRQLLLDRPVAVKVMSPTLLKNPKTVKNFLMEGKVMAKLDHPSIVRVYSTIEERGIYFLIMEYVRGRNLKDIIAAEGPLTARKALRIVRQVAEVLAFAHSHSVIHLDIKPANVLLAEGGQVKVTDFGISHLLKRSGEAKLSGNIFGTPAYMSPEQCLGDKLSGTSDIYSLGATLYTLLTGRQPFTCRKGTSIAEQVVNNEPTALEVLAPNLPERVIALVQRMMTKDPNVRYQGADEVVATIDSTLSGDLYPGKGSSWLQKLRPARLTWWHVACAVFAVWGLGLVYWSLSSRLWFTNVEASGRVDPGGVDDPSGGTPPHEPTDNPPPLDPTMPKSLNDCLEAFREYLASGKAADVVKFVHPGKRGHPGVRRAWMERVDFVQSKGIADKGRYEISVQDDQQATVILQFPGGPTESPIAFRLRWSLHSDGAWYILPEMHDYLRG